MSLVAFFFGGRPVQEVKELTTTIKKISAFPKTKNKILNQHQQPTVRPKDDNGDKG